MFKRAEHAAARNGAGPGRDGLDSIFGEGCHLQGTLRIEGSVRIDGEFEGTINATESVVIGRHGTVTADVEAREVIVSGRVNGKLVASERVELQEGSRLDGDVLSPSFVIADGVAFNGNCKMEPSGGTSTTTDKPVLTGIATTQEKTS